MERYFNVGKIVNTHGIHGEVRVISKTDFPDERYAPGSSLQLFMMGEKFPIELIVKTHRKHKNFDLLSFEGYSNINDVEKWKNGLLKVAEKYQTDLSKGEYYFHQIIGCEVFTVEEESLGKIIEILTPGANDVWVVKRSDGKEFLIPYIDDVVEDINVLEKKITIRLIEGLIE